MSDPCNAVEEIQGLALSWFSSFLISLNKSCEEKISVQMESLIFKD